MIENKVALVTGVSSGIGREIAQLLAERGARVFGTVRDHRSTASVAGVELVHMDVTNDASVAEAVQSLLLRAGEIHALVNNAGYALLGGLEETSPALDHEVRTFGIRAVLVEPAFTKTNLERNGKTALSTLDAYADQRKRVEEVFQQEIARGDEPRAVAEIVFRALTAPSPRPRYPVGKSVVLSRLRRFVPARLFDPTFRSQFQLDEPIRR
jgi:NAD(P)-dependent dehydrogenase (short-subunit alcohol dehydrogenase family)